MSPASAEGPSHISRFHSSWRGNQKPEAITPPQKNPEKQNKSKKKGQKSRGRKAAEPHTNEPQATNHGGGHPNRRN
eukprot:6528411-Prymnesium_polylepis.1